MSPTKPGETPFLRASEQSVHFLVGVSNGEKAEFTATKKTFLDQKVEETHHYEIAVIPPTVILLQLKKQLQPHHVKKQSDVS